MQLLRTKVPGTEVLHEYLLYLYLYHTRTRRRGQAGRWCDRDPGQVSHRNIESDRSIEAQIVKLFFRIERIEW